MKLEIDRTLVCTTSHITAEDNQQLFDEETNLVVYSMDEYGYMIWTGGNTFQLYMQEAKNISDSFRILLTFAKQQKCEWLRLDRDAEEIEGLETFEW